MKICKNCRKKFNNRKDLKILKNSKFCSGYCSRSYSTKFDNKNETKIVNCIDCNKTIVINKRASSLKCKCDICKKHKTCKQCGQEICKNKKICNLIKKKRCLLLFGFNENVLGTLDVYKEYDRIIQVIIKEYIDNKLCLEDICLKYKYPYGAANLWNLIKSINDNFKFRSLSDSLKNRLLTGKVNFLSNIISHRYHSGWHITWNNKKIFYRSSFELDYCKELDIQQIDYEVENLRIEYWDSSRCKYRIAIPDFYLPDSNTIVEIKSEYTYDKQNMDDKIKAYKKLGYGFKLILDKVEQ